MNLQQKSQEVRRVFEELDAEIKLFIDASQIGCIAGCGYCCSNPKVSASILEFLPLAFDLYEKGKAEKALEILDAKSEADYCIIYKATSLDAAMGFCSDYQNRGMICRLFGSSARTNRTGKKEIITCKKIKESKKEQYESASLSVNEGMPVPLSSSAYSQLYNIDFQLTSEQMPINKAIQKALEAVLRFKYYEGSETSEAAESF
ncbi:YkgJ family cysteine cluster protein [Aquiflexum gelatinilyticum]|uniref:YkgJ family cysteine cluster protein n=1 Tax=Aquiflexum gelatinilyticum TaxID=2961943 RepID=UPI002168FEF6|nr:YkgJ family cysteine cluster protein [Aquiflexum gelatinilyticum]MCS4435605.1 YkgJ family cysteine cluster protein [Aquiflexum gelatinilyticum]